MHLLLVNLYEFGQFVRILLWISVPLIIITLSVATWLHYRSRRKGAGDELRLSMEGLDISADPGTLLAAIQGRRMVVGEEGGGGDGGEETVRGEERMEETQEIRESERNRMYKGILWMKEKYEQYRDLADQRIEQLKEELARSEQRYQALLDQRMEGRQNDHPAASPEEQQRQLEEKDHQIEDLRRQLQTQNQLTEELVIKLQNSSQLLLKISKELDGSLPSATEPRI